MACSVDEIPAVLCPPLNEREYALRYSGYTLVRRLHHLVQKGQADALHTRVALLVEAIKRTYNTSLMKELMHRFPGLSSCCH